MRTRSGSLDQVENAWTGSYRWVSTSVAREFVVHYHRERNHQRLGNELMLVVEAGSLEGGFARRQRIGRLLSYYYHAA
jgi:hypothetical protein